MRPVQALCEGDRLIPARHRDGVAPPVFDAAGRLLGCVPPEAMLAVGRRAQPRRRLDGRYPAGAETRRRLAGTPNEGLTRAAARDVAEHLDAEGPPERG